ncbi:MAG: serine hydrolase, partial [Actinobacteria bacterium]|nr:serine hydrolase [Actinomycetota bacterium]
MATESLTPRDLLCHRSGLSRHDWMWQGGRRISRAEAVALLRYLQPNKPFRSTFQYNNLMYMTAGHLCEVVTGDSWEDLVTRRIFERASMTSSSFSQESGVATEVSLPYGKRRGNVTQIPYANEPKFVAPAGGIYSTLTDMMKWLEISLNSGQLGGVSVLSADTVGELFSSQMVIRIKSTSFTELADDAYGLGWIIGNYRGRKLVHHGGNIDGFSSLVAMLPEDRIGVVILTNRYSSFIPWAVALRAFDELLELEPLPWGKRFFEHQEIGESGGEEAKARAHPVPGTKPSHPLKAYTGTFSHPAYGSIVVKAERDTLSAEFRMLRVTMPHRHYDTFTFDIKLYENTQLYASFLTDPEGNITAVSIPFEPNVESIVFKREPELPPVETCERLAGVY